LTEPSVALSKKKKKSSLLHIIVAEFVNTNHFATLCRRPPSLQSSQTQITLQHHVIIYRITVCYVIGHRNHRPL
jgi:hypothetical protein